MIYRTIEFKAKLTYDAEGMHGNDPDALKWFDEILRGDNLKLADFGDMGDIIGGVKVIEYKERE